MQKGFEKRFNHGDIVFFHRQEGHKHFVGYGMVDEQFSDAVCVDLLKPKEDRVVNGVPIDELPAVGRWHKLPKGYRWDTKLIDITSSYTEFEHNFPLDITNPASIKHAYDVGMLVKADTIFWGDIDDEVSKDGWRIVLKYPMYKTVLTRLSIRPDMCYFTYAEAKDVVDEYNAEFKRQSELTDLEWSIEQIEKVLNRIPMQEEVRLAYLHYLLKMKDVEDLEVRYFMGYIQWKYWKNKKWNSLEVDEVMREWEWDKAHEDNQT